MSPTISARRAEAAAYRLERLNRLGLGTPVAREARAGRGIAPTSAAPPRDVGYGAEHRDRDDADDHAGDDLTEEEQGIGGVPRAPAQENATPPNMEIVNLCVQ